MRRTTIGYLMIGLLVVAASLAATPPSQAAWARLAALGFEAVGDHACTDGITFRLTDLHPRTYTANHVVITSTVTFEKIVDEAFEAIPASPIKVDFDGQGYIDYGYSGYYTMTWSPAQASGISVTLDFQDPQTSQPEIPIADCVVADLPAITSQPANRVIDDGQTATLTVAAQGEATLSYQWYQGISGDTTTLVGTDSPTLTTTALITDTNYWVRVSNGWGSVDSNTATAVIASEHVYLPLIKR
jgi:Ig-like domain CHU_C associated